MVIDQSDWIIAVWGIIITYIDETTGKTYGQQLDENLKC